MRDWFESVVPGLTSSKANMVLHGDLPKADWFSDTRSTKLSAQDGEIHTVAPGRPIGLHPHNVAELAAAGVHLHFYGDFTHGQWREWIDRTENMAAGRLHLHANAHQTGWVSEFSKYDVGWLHFIRSENEGEISRANLDDLNLPARMATLAATGLPMVQCENEGAIVATQALTKLLDIGVFGKDIAGVVPSLRDSERLNVIANNAWAQREQFSFDHHADDLIQFFRTVISLSSR